MKNTILLIEDNDDIRDNTAEILELANYSVIKARNGKEGLDMIKKSNPSLILCDIMMPELDGYGVLSAIENIEEAFGTPFIFLSALGDKKDIRSGMTKGADDYLTKPFSSDELLQVVGARLKKSKAMKEPFKKNQQGLEEFFNGSKSIKELNFITDKTPIKKLKKKGTLFTEGDISNFLYYVVSGKIKTYKTNDDGKDYILNIYQAGDFFGHQALFNDNTHKESAAAIENSEIATISKNDFYQLLYSSSEVSLKFIKYISNNLIEAEEKLLQMAYNSARKKVAEALLLLNKKYNPENGSKPFITNRETLSSLSGLTPESISRNMSDFKNEKLIENENGLVTILDLRKLEHLKN